MRDDLFFRWEGCPGGARLLRVYGDTPRPVLPAAVAGLPVTEIGPYCFSEKERPGGALFPPGAPAGALHPICGDFVQAVTLPASVELLHSGAFYNCRRLENITLGPAVRELGSDLFTNCRALGRFTVAAAPDAPTCLPKLLGAVSADICAAFAAPGAPGALLFYPEYSELLDENAPAHIFSRTIVGEGYRYRQCFAGGAVRYAEYDAAFALAKTGEPPEKLCRLALARLLFPFALTAAARQSYRACLAEHPAAAGELAAARADAPALRLLLDLGPDAARRAELAARCAAHGWSEGAALALTGGEHRKKSYSFDPF